MEPRDRMREFINLYTWYIVIGVASLIALLFLPFLGSTVGIGLAVPDTTAGWIVWVTVKAIVAVINVLIFHAFMQQAKVNVRNDRKYKEALEILGKVKRKNYTPRSPEKWTRAQYGRKGTMIAITTALATVALTQAILTFDWVSMLTYLFTIVMGLILGVIQMKSAETYWTDEFWRYAKQIEKEEDNHDNSKRDGAPEPAGAGVTESERYTVPTEGRGDAE